MSEVEGLTCEELKSEIENLNKIMETLGQDLNDTKNENKSLNFRISKLNQMVLEREEEIVKLKLELDVLRFGFSNEQRLENNKNKSLKKPVNSKPFYIPLSNSFQVLAESNVGKEKQHFSLQHSEFPPLHFSKKTLKNTLVPKSKKSLTSTSFKGECHKSSTNKPLSDLQNIIIISDSHGRDLSYKVQRRTTSCVTATVRPGAMLSGVIHDMNEQIKGLTKCGAAVLIGGTNDLEKRSENLILHDIQQQIQTTLHTNLILATLPLRHDKPELDEKLSYLNSEIEHLAESEDHVFILPLHLLPRHLYTSHGLHFNNKGKEKISLMIKEIFQNIKHKISNQHRDVIRSQVAYSNIVSSSPKSQSTGKNVQEDSTDLNLKKLEDGISIAEADMSDVINRSSTYNIQIIEQNQSQIVSKGPFLVQ
ncbi:hypothetical protein J6590_000226 [Homalodisca vitripennis]|nr:hypothetical protein J6590_000226 [Homalodisca vitripennis]